MGKLRSGNDRITMCYGRSILAHVYAWLFHCKCIHTYTPIICLLPSGLYRRPWNFPRSCRSNEQLAGFTADQELETPIKDAPSPCPEDNKHSLSYAANSIADLTKRIQEPGSVLSAWKGSQNFIS